MMQTSQSRVIQTRGDKVSVTSTNFRDADSNIKSQSISPRTNHDMVTSRVGQDTNDNI